MSHGKEKKSTSLATVIIWLIIFFPIGIYFYIKKSIQDSGKEFTLRNRLAIWGWMIVIFATFVLGIDIFVNTPSTNPNSATTDMGGFIRSCYVVGGIFLLISFLMRSNKSKNATKDNTYKKNNFSNQNTHNTANSPNKSYVKQKVYQKTTSTTSDVNFNNMTGNNLVYQDNETGELCADMDQVKNMMDKAFGGVGGMEGMFNASINNISQSNKVKSQNDKEEMKSNVKQDGTYRMARKPKIDEENNLQTSGTKVKVVACKNCGASNKVTEGNVTECEFCGSLLQ